MATQQVADAGGTTVSFSNTPQAKDDVFYFSEDSTGVLILNVLANDLGGSAKLLYSIDNSISASTATKTPAPSDLLIRDTTYSATNDNAGLAGTTDTSLLGARIWIASDGTIHYNTTDINTLLQSLAQGQVLTDKLTYAIQLGNGTLSWATTTIQFTGTNDKPVIGAATLVGAVTEDAHTPTETATGTIAFGDVDLTDVHVVSSVFKSTDYSGQLGSLNAVKTTDTTGSGSGGLITWTFSAADSALDKLAAGQVVHETYTVTLDDQHGGTVTRDVVITITGTNDQPVIGAATLVGAVTEDAHTPTETATGTIAFGDVDLTDVHVVSSVFKSTDYSGQLGSLNAVKTTDTTGSGSGGLITWTFSAADSALDKLAAGQVVHETYTVTLDDQHGGTVTRDVVITITGTNDQPVIGAATLVGAVTEDAHTPTETATGTIAFGDVDLTDVHVVSSVFKSTDYSGQLGSLNAVKTTDTTGSGSGGLITWTFSAADSALDKLAAGQVVHETYTVTLDDQHGGTVTRDVVITITGTNDQPVIGAATLVGAVTEDAHTPTETATGTIAFGDVDLTDVHVVSSVFKSTDYSGQLGSLNAVKTTDTTGSGSGGLITWTFSAADSALDKLAAGQVVHETYTVTLDDQHGGTVTRDVVITITGTNDDPTITAAGTDATGAVTEDAADPTLSDTGTIAFNDIDLIDVHTTSVTPDASNTLGGTLTMGSVTEDGASEAGTVGWTYEVANSATQYLAVGETATEKFTVSVDDGHGGTVDQVVTVTVTGTNDDPTITAAGTDATGAVTEDAADPTLSDTGTIAFNDVDLIDVHTTSVTPDASNTLGGTLTMGSVTEDGASEAGTVGWTYEVANSATQYLAVGETATEKFTVSVDDGHGGTVDQVVTVTVTGTNDDPTITAAGTDATGAVTEDAADPTLSDTGTIAFNDVDLIDVHTTSVTPDASNTLGGTLTMGSVTEDGASEAGTVGWTYEVANSATQYLAVGETATEKFTVSVDDGHGGTVDQVVTVTVTGTNDDPTITAAGTDATGAVTEDAADPTLSDTGTIAFNDIDLIDVHTTSVTPDASNTLGGTLTMGSVTEDGASEAGTVGWTYEVANSATQYLAVGETATEKFTVSVDDGHGGTVDQVVTVTVTGTNDDPTITAAGTDATGAVTEDAADPTLSDTGTIAFNDVDLIDVHTTSVTPDASNTLGGTLTMGSVTEDGASEAGTVGWTYEVANSATQYLAVGETATEKFTVSVDDGHGGTVDQVVTVTVTGTNDDPTITAAGTDATGAVTEDAADPTLSDTGTIAFNDIDLIDVHTTSVTPDASNTLGGTLTMGSVTEDGASEAGTVGWTYEVANSATQYLAVGETATEKFTVSVDDGHGGTVDQVVTVTVTGTNDDPTITAAGTDATGAVTEDAADPTLSDTGTIAFNDVDLIDVHTTSVTPDASNTLGGTLTMGSVTEDGASEAGTVGWTYEVANSATQYLAVGETATEKFTVSVDDGHGGTVDQVVTVTVTGTNDDPTITAAGTDATGAVTEDAADPTLSDTGTIAFNDVDLIDVHTTSVTPDASNTLGGTLTMGSVTEDGASEAGTVGWTYEVANSATQYLAVGETATEKFTVSVDDGHGGTVDQVVTVTVTGTNDDPTITAAGTDATGAVTEDAADPTLSDTGTIAFNDVDLIDVHTTSVTPDASNTLGGTLTMGSVTEDGASEAGTVGWTYEVANSATQYLAVGETATEKFTVSVDDGHGGTVDQVVTVTVTGTNDDPTITAAGTDATGAVTEDAADPTLSDTGTIAFNDVDLIDVHTTSVTPDASNTLGGTLTMGSVTEDGASEAGTVGWTYEVANSATQYLAVGETATEKFTVSVDDGHGGTVDQVVTVTVTGTNDDPTITAAGTDATGAVTEDAADPTLSDTGTIAFNDVDLIDVHTTSVTPDASNTLGGTLTMGSVTEDGASEAGTVGWTYEVANSATQYLAVGETATEKFTVSVDDGHGGTVDQVVTVTVTGTNDDPTITAAGTDATGAVTEDTPAGATETASGTVSFADVDLTDTHTVSASFVSSTNAGGLQLGTLTAAKTLDTSGGTGGTGTWNYSVNNSAIQFLAAGQTIQETYQVTVADNHGGSTSQNVVVTITGTNDNPTVSATATGSVTEDTPAGATETASGTVSFADVDLTDTHTVSASFVSSTNAGGLQLGTLTAAKTLDTSGGTGGTGTWNYSVNNSAIQFLAAGQTIQETYQVTVADNHGGSTSQNVVVTITGTNDNPTVSATATGSVTEDTPAGATETASGTVSFADVDLTDTHTVSASFVSSTNAGGLQLGTLTAAKTLDTSGGTGGTGTWNYSVNNSAIQFLAAGQTIQETYQVTVADNHGGSTSQNVVVTITGTNDNPTVSATATGSVTEDTPAGATETASGTVSFADVDLTDTHTVSASFVSSTNAGGLQLGTLTAAKTLDTSGGTGGTGTWNYSVNNSAIQFLAAGQTIQETYQVTVADNHGGSTSQNVVVTITGTNDNPTVSATATGSVTEDTPAGATETASGTVSFADVDLTDTHTVSASFVSSTNAGGLQLGTLTAAKTLDTSGGTGGTGTWNYSVNNSAIQFLAAGQTIQETYQVTVADNHGGSTSQNVVVTITGTNDNPTVSATATGSVTEDTPAGATETASGTVSFADVDLTDTHTVSASFVSSTNAGGLQLGTLTAAKTLDTSGGTGGTGTWNYSVNNSAIQFLAAGQTIQETYQVTVADNHGGSTSQNVVVTITGTNDNPTVSATATGSVTEDTPAGATETASGTVSFADVDLTDTHTVSASFVSSTNAGGLQLGTLTAAKTLDTSGGTGGTGTWNYSVNNSAIQFLAAGQTIQETYQVTVADNHGGSTSQNVVVTITGTNDAPVIDLNGGSPGTSTSVNYTAGSAATAIAPSASITDIDSTDFNGGSLTVAFTANGTSADQLTVQNQGTGVGQIGVSGSNVTYQGTTIGTFSGGTNGSNLVITFNANATQPAVAALADHILYSNATSPTATKTVTYTLVDGDGTANGGTDTGTATATISVTGGGQAPVVDLNGPGSGNDATASYPSQTSPLSIATSATITDADSTTLTLLTATLTNRPDDGIGNPKEFLSLTSAANTAATAAGLTVNYDTSTGILSIAGSATVATYQTILRGLQYADTKTGAHDQTPRVINVIVSDGANTSISHSITVSVAKPAGTAGEPINLALSDPSHEGALVTVTVRDMPSGWSIDGATQNVDGSWTVQSSAVHELTVTTPTDYAGAAVLDIQMSWTNADGTTGSMFVADNVEAYAPGSPIFAWSGDDTLTGSSGHDLFVFSQPIGNDTVHSFDAAADQIDLIGYSGLSSFGALQAHISDDAHGNAVITLADGQSITLDGVHSSALGADNFVFDQTPEVNNAGTMTLSDGALLPLSGTVNNSGVIALNSTGSETLLQVIQHGVTLQGGGQVVLSDNAANVISGTGPDVTLVNIDNTISGAGQLGDGMLGLDNRGTIIASGTNALVIDTGGSVVINSGTLAATGSGGLVVAGGVANSGMIEANGGNVVIHGQVTGDGDATIGNLSKLEFGAASSTDVTFAQNAAGTLELDDSFDYSGRISGITNDDKLDLNDILFGVGTTVAYQASQDGAGGTLTVSDGAHNATLHLLGTYDANGFKLADDGQGHTVVTYNPAEFTLTGVSGVTSEFAV